MSFRAVADVAELRDDAPLAVDVDDIAVAIVRHEGEYFAIRDQCSHAAVPLSDGDVEGCTIECYLHGAAFDLRTGRAVQLPATQPVPVFPVRVEGTTVEVDIDNPINQTQEH